MKFIKHILFLSFFCLLSCVHTQETSKNQFSLVVDRDRIWKVMVKVFKSYPIKNIDSQSGYIETEWMDGELVWKAPFQKSEKLYGYSYKIEAYLNYNEPISTVSFHKTAYKQKGFISQKERVPSDGLEETALQYHIVRELELGLKLNL